MSCIDLQLAVTRVRRGHHHLDISTRADAIEVVCHSAHCSKVGSTVAVWRYEEG